MHLFKVVHPKSNSGVHFRVGGQVMHHLIVMWVADVVLLNPEKERIFLVSGLGSWRSVAKKLNISFLH